MNEVWKDVVGFEGLYEVSNLGFVRRCSGNMARCNASKPLRVVGHIHNGYMRVCLQRDGVGYREMVHRTVARAFLPPARKGAQINHKDGNKENNNVENLEWCTSQENIRHAWKIGLNKPNQGEKHGASKLQPRDIEVIRSARSRGVSLVSLAEVFDVSQGAISSIDRFKTWRHIPLENAV